MGGARTSDPDTSFQAYNLVIPSIGRIQLRVMEIFEMYPEGLTDRELTDIYREKFPPAYEDDPEKSTARTRRNELTKSGAIVDTGSKRYAPGRTRGTRHKVWRHAAFDNIIENPPKALARTVKRIKEGDKLTTRDRSSARQYARRNLGVIAQLELPFDESDS